MPWLIPDAHAQAVEAAREIVLRRLDRSAAPRSALAELLERKEVDPRVAAEVLERLEAAGVIDDTAYAARLARTRFAEKGAARRAIAEELRRKGLGEQDVTAALEQISSDDEDTAALALARPIVHEARAADVGLLPHREGLRASLGSGTPLLIRSLSLRVAILATVWAATALGDVSLAAHQVVNALWTFAAFALDALAVAAQALIGTALGQAQREDADSAVPDAEALTEEEAGTAAATAGWSIDELLRRMLTWGAGTGALIGTLMAVGAAWLPRAFTSDAGVIAAATPTLLVAASAQPLAGVVFLLDGVLMGAGDGRYLARAGLVTLVPYVPLALLIGGGVLPGSDGATSGLVLLWVAFAWVFMAARGATTYLRARGIPPEEARRLIVRRFFSEVIGRIPVAAIREDLENRVAAELEALQQHA